MWLDGKKCPSVPVVPPMKYFMGSHFLPDNPVAWYAGVLATRLLKFKPEYLPVFSQRAAALGMALPGENRSKTVCKYNKKSAGQALDFSTTLSLPVKTSNFLVCKKFS